jgi:L-asparaginase
VTKTHAYRVGAFTSMEHGKLGEVDGDEIVLHRRPARRLRIETQQVEPRVDLVKLVMGSDERFIRCAVESGARGIVLEAFGRGNATLAVVAAAREVVAAGIPVLVATRCPQGRVRPIYGKGGGKDLEEAGAIFAGDLSGIKARVLLSALLGAGATRESIAETVAEISG